MTTYECTSCDYKSTNKSNAKQHISICEEGAEINTVLKYLTCDMCDKKFENDVYLKRHLKSCKEKRSMVIEKFINGDNIAEALNGLNQLVRQLLKEQKEGFLLVNKRLENIEARLNEVETERHVGRPHKEPIKKEISKKLELREKPMQCDGTTGKTVFCPESYGLLTTNIRDYYGDEEVETIQVSIGTKKSKKYFAEYTKSKIIITLDDGEEMSYYFNSVKRGCDEPMKSAKDLFVHLSKPCESAEATYYNKETHEFYCEECARNFEEE
jgi:hypothetical protein